MKGLSAARLSDAQKQHFRENGYLFPLYVLDDGEAAEYRARLEAFEADWGARARQILRQKCHLVLTWADALIRHPNLLGPVSDLLGPDLLVWSTSFFIKDARDPGFVSWHQDSTYWGLDNDDTVSAWVALSHSRPKNGCMRVIPGSHRLVRMPHHETQAPDNLLSRGQEIAVEVDESAAVDFILEPGQASLHHALIVHGSKPNSSDERRIGLAIRYIRPQARQVEEAWDSATLVLGQDRSGHFELEPRPARDLDPAALAYHESVLTRKAGGLYRAKQPGS